MFRFAFVFLLSTVSACATAPLDRMPGPGGDAIAFDYDNTCSATPDLCADFFLATHQRGLTPIILTARAEALSGSVREYARKMSERLGFEIPVVSAGGQLKSAAAARAGYRPLMICDDRSVTPELAALKVAYVCGADVPAPNWLERMQSLPAE